MTTDFKKKRNSKLWRELASTYIIASLPVGYHYFVRSVFSSVASGFGSYRRLSCRTQLCA